MKININRIKMYMTIRALLVISPLIAIGGERNAQYSTTSTVDASVIERVTSQLVELLLDDSSVASIKIRRLLDLMPDNYNYESSKILRQAKCRVAAYELENSLNDFPEKTKRPVKWGAFMVVDSVSHGPDYRSIRFCNINDDGTHAGDHGGENHTCEACAKREQTGDQVAHNCWYCTQDGYLEFEDGSRESFHLSLNVFTDPFQRDDKQRGGLIWVREQVYAANDNLLRQRQEQAETQQKHYAEKVKTSIPQIKANLQILLTLDKSDTLGVIKEKARSLLALTGASVDSSEKLQPVEPASTQKVCTTCNGEGKVWKKEIIDACPFCGGSGWVGNWRCGKGAASLGKCGGTGKIITPGCWEKCSTCGGTGKM